MPTTAVLTDIGLDAGENVIGAVGSPSDLVEVMLSLDTAAYVSGDVLADTQVVTNAVRVAGGCAVLQSLHVLDEDDQGAAFDLLFLRAGTSIGTENAAPSIADAGARDILGIVSVTADNYADIGGSRIATIVNVGLFLKAAAGSRDLYLAAITRGSPTYTAGGLRVKLGMLWG